MTEFRSIWCALLGFFVSVCITACGDDGTAGGKLTCAEGQLGCEGACVDLQIDSLNCGGCNLLCPAGSTCGQGMCRDAQGGVVAAISDGPVTCATGDLLCGTTCANPMTSDANCGGCGVACGAGQVCDLGVCRDIGSGCPMGRLLCDGTCVDVSNDPDNCGACNTPCGSGNCLGGACACPLPQALCKLGCADLTTDTENCGTCGVVCAEGQLCTSGSCQCSPGQSLCDSGCVDLATSTDNCGSCGTACDSSEICSAGACVCSSGLTACASGCVDVSSSAEDCGACGVACTGGQVCASGSCACPTGQTDCDGQCADLENDAANCGGCGTACAADEVCTGGSCVCPEGATSCDGTCVDTATSVDHCGGCGIACFEGQVCNASTCECPEALTACGEACLDLETDAENCGACGTACTGGQVCQMGACECPEGQSLCDDVCIDTQTDALNCGGCGIACGLGELCNDASCQGGGLGDDGCEGVAQGLTLRKVSFYQTVEIPVMLEGQSVEDRLEIVTGRDTLVRVLVDVGDGWSARELSARLFLDDGSERFTVYTSEPQNIADSSEDEDRDSAFEFMVTGDQLREATSYAVEVVECGEAPNSEVLTPRFPEMGGAELRAITTGGLRIHLVPLRWNNREPTTTDEVIEQFRAGFLSTYPIDSVEFTISETYDIYDPEDWTYNLEALRQLRISEDPDPGVYYYGIVRPTENIGQFCGYGCTAGIGYVPMGDGPYAQTGRVSMGLAYDDEESIRTMLHEVGHNHGRNHAPCVPPGAYIAGVDPYFPHDDAALGVVGYDIRNDRLISPDAPDIMAYCQDPWISDYTYEGLMDTVRNVNSSAFVVASADRQGDFVTLLVGDGRTPRWFPPKFDRVAEGSPVPLEILNAAGDVIDVVTGYRNDMADVTAFSLDVPLPQADWDAVRVDSVGAVKF